MPKLKNLSEKYWTAIDMKWQSFSYYEIAKKLGVSLDTVKSWFRSNGLLRKHYEDYCEDKIIERERKNTPINIQNQPEPTK